jgi:hypothetical protein
VNKVVVVGLLRMKLVAMIVDDVWGTKVVSMKVEDVRWMNVVVIIWRKCFEPWDQR